MAGQRGLKEGEKTGLTGDGVWELREGGEGGVED